MPPNEDGGDSLPSPNPSEVSQCNYPKRFYIETSITINKTYMDTYFSHQKAHVSGMIHALDSFPSLRTFSHEGMQPHAVWNNKDFFGLHSSGFLLAFGEPQ